MKWLRVKPAAEYADVSPRTLYRWFVDGLKHRKVRGVPFTTDEWIDEFIENHSDDRIDSIVDEVIAEIEN